MQPRLKLLIADDEPIIRDTVRLMLGNIYEIDQTDCAKGLRKIISKGFDAVLLDIMFPDGNGIDLCREIKTAFPDLTVVISSSMETVDAWNSAFEAGADSYMEKREILNQDPRKISLMINNLVERNRLRRKADEQNKWQAELLSVLSHDVRAPFQSLLSSLDLLGRADIKPELKDVISETLQSARQQLSFINSLLELLRLESRAINLRMSTFDPNLPVNQSVQTLMSLIKEKDINLALHLDEDLPEITGDIAQIARMVTNLLSNATKFTRRGGQIEVCSRHFLNGGVSTIEIQVKDNGIGIKKTELEEIFDKFHRAKDRGTEGEAGSGLGLAICKELALLHGGDLSVESALGTGSCFSIRLPLGK